MRHLSIALVLVGALAHAEKPEKVPVALGSWKGPSASTFKSALRRGLAKDCTFVKAKKARALIEGEVTSADGKKLSVKVIVKATTTGEVVEQRSYQFAKPSVSAAMASKMGREVADSARRAPTPDTPAPP